MRSSPTKQGEASVSYEEEYKQMSNQTAGIAEKTFD